MTENAPILPPWPDFPYANPDEYGFFSGVHPKNGDQIGHFAGKPDHVPLLLAVLLLGLNTYESDSAVATLFARYKLHRYTQVLHYENGPLLDAAWSQLADTEPLSPLQKQLIALQALCEKMLPRVYLCVEGLSVLPELAFAVQAMNPPPISHHQTDELVTYRRTGPFRQVVEAAQDLVDDLLMRCAFYFESNGVEVVDARWVRIPGYQPLFEVHDCNWD